MFKAVFINYSLLVDFGKDSNVAWRDDFTRDADNYNFSDVLVCNISFIPKNLVDSFLKLS